MEGAPVTPETTLAILLGGSAFPKSPQLAASPGFAASADDFRQYLTSADGFRLPPGNVLDLFDSPKTSPEIVEAVTNYLRDRAKAMPAPRDLLLYYTGHGGFINGKDYFLAVRSTIEGLEGTSSIRVSDLASALRGSARDLRRFVILDCCFAAAAFKEFQSSPGAVARMQTLDAFPRRGTTLLCSSSPRSVSIAPQGERNTMFSGALLEVLRRGDPALQAPMSLEDVGMRVGELLRDRYDARAVRPEVHSPDQREEDIARIPLFPNAAAGVVPQTASVRPRVEPPPLPRRRPVAAIAGAAAVVAIIGVAGVLNWPDRQPTETAAAVQSVRPEPTTTPAASPAPPALAPVTAGREVAARTEPARTAARPATADARSSAAASDPLGTAPAASRPAPTALTVNGANLRFVSVPGGQLTVGCSSADPGCSDDRPARRVVIDPIQISATEVTQEVWEAVMGRNPSDFTGGRGRPVEHVSWTDAQEFAERLTDRGDGFTYRLPSEDEWEYAARGGGSPPTLAEAAWFALADSGSRGRPQGVGLKAANAWGLYDMLGNVAEWCADWFSPNYQRVVRGGSWLDSPPGVGISARAGAAPGTRDYSIGVRLVRVPK